MTNQEIFDLMDRFQRSSLRSMKLSCQDFSIELEQGAPAAAAAAAPAAVPAPTAAAAPAPQPESPVIPDQPPCVNTGGRVKKGQTVCLIEAMKMMSEVPAPCDCVIEEVLKANGELAAFGEPLFRYRPC